MDPIIITESTTIEDIFCYAMAEEKYAAAFYKKAATHVSDPIVKAFLIELAKKENEHFLDLKKKLEDLEAEHFSVVGILDSFDSNH